MKTLIYFFRSVWVLYVLMREGVFRTFDWSMAPVWMSPLRGLARVFQKNRSPGQALCKALTRLGPTYVKLGQFLSTRPDLIGMELATVLESLQDRQPAFPRKIAIQCVEKAMGKPIDRCFSFFSESIATASIAQVHKARVQLETGEENEVAVKIMQPGVVKKFQKDLHYLIFLADLSQRHIEVMKRLRPKEVVSTLARVIKFETDFRLEAAAMSEFAELINTSKDVRVPRPYWDYIARDVLTCEWIEGISLNKVDELVRKGYDLKSIARRLLQTFLRQAIFNGFFHADLHPGNILIDSQQRLCLVDFGVMGRLGDTEKHFLAEILLGFIEKDYERVARVHFEAGYVSKAYSLEEFSQAIRAIGEPIHQKSVQEISMAKILTLLFDITDLFDMNTRIELVLLQKTMVVVEGVARKLDPNLNLWDTAKPIIQQWMMEKITPESITNQVKVHLDSVIYSIKTVPRLIELMENRLRTDIQTTTLPVRYVRRQMNYESRFLLLSLSVLALVMAYTVWVR